MGGVCSVRVCRFPGRIFSTDDFPVSRKYDNHILFHYLLLEEREEKGEAGEGASASRDNRG